MESIIYNISNAYFPVTVYLKEGYVPGGAVIATNTHNFAGEYSFDNVLEGQYTILVVDIFGCTKMINTPPIEEDCELDGFIECGLTTTTLEVTTTVEITTTTLVESCVEYGVLYNWYAVADERNIAAEGWSIPDNTINQQLADNLGGEAIAGKKLKSVSSWVINTGTNSSGFNAKGAGYRHNTGEFVGLMESSYIWTSIEDPITPTEAYSSDLYDSGDYFNVGLYSKTKNTGATIRLKKDTTILNPGETGIYIGNDLRQYYTICIADSDGNNKQEWLADNLMETKFRNGDTISWHGANPINYFTDIEWVALTTAGMCVYDNDVANVGCDFQFPTVTTTIEPTTTLSPTTTIEPTTTVVPTTTTEATTTTEPTTTGIALVDVNYGYLYNYYAARSVNNITSSDGWVLPSTTQCRVLSDYLGVIGDYSSNNDAGLEMKEVGTTYWVSDNGSTNSSGFNGRGAGLRNSSGTFETLGTDAQHWLSDDSGGLGARGILNATTDGFSTSAGYLNPKNGLPIRLLKTSTTLSNGQTGTYTGNDGKIYRTICIGTQEWLADSLCETLYRSLDAITEVTDGTTWAALATGARCSYDNTESNAINP